MHLIVVTPTLGRSRFLDDTVSSIYGLDARVQHIICCPSDQIAALKERFPLSQVVADQGKTAGIYGAINAGLSAAREPWDFFTYLNDDDLIGRDFGAMFKRHAIAANRNTIAFGWISNIDRTGRKVMEMTVGPNPRQYPALLQMGTSPTGQQGMIFGREVVEAVGFYSTHYKLCGDLDYWCRAMAAGFRFVFYPLEAGRFRMQEGQLSSDTETTRRELAQITRIHFPREASTVEKLQAKLVYRLYNAPRYVRRIKKWGFKTSYELLESKMPAGSGSDMEVVILNDHGNFTGGASSVALQSAVALANRGIRTTLFTAVGPLAAALENRDHLEVICTGQHEIASDPNRLRSFFQGIWNQKAITDLTRLLSSRDPTRTIVHVHTWMKALSPGAILTALNRGFRVAITLHDFSAVCPSGGFYVHRSGRLCSRRPLSTSCLTCNCDRRAYSHKLWRFARAAVQNWCFKIAERIHHYIGVSEFSVELMKPYLPRGVPVTIVRNPIECNDSGPTAVDSNSSFVFVGRFAPEKGVELFAAAADRAGVPAIFVGGGELESDLRRRFRRATFLGWLENGQVTNTLRLARALVFPSLWYETLGLSAIEAMANGVPVIVSDRCAASEFVQDGYSGLHFRRGSVESLASQLRRLCDNDFALRLGRNAYDWYWRNPWSLDAHVDQLSDVYLKTLQSS